MEKKRNIQVGNFFWFGEEIVQVYDKCAWELLPDNEHKNRYSVVNKEGELFGCNEENLKDILISNELLESCFYEEEPQGEVGKDYSVTRTVEHIGIHWNPIRILAQLSLDIWETKVKEDKRWFANAGSVSQLQNILNALNDMGRIHDILVHERVYNIDMKVKQFLWRD